jgi:hypothetical protein
MVRIGRVDGPISGLLSQELLDAARESVPECDLPHSTAPMDPRLAWTLGKLPGSHESQDLRGRVVDSAFSILMPRRLITLAPTLDGGPPPGNHGGGLLPPAGRRRCRHACGDVVVLRGGMGALQQGLDLIQPLVG